MRRALVTGAAGFIGGHLCRFLKDHGYWVRAVDLVPPRYGDVPCDEGFWNTDLRTFGNISIMTGVDEIYALAADMGGMGYISGHHFDILYSNALINLHTACNAQFSVASRIFYSSSACVYPEKLQMGYITDETFYKDTPEYQLSERDAWLGKPDTAYGIEKLFSEELYHRLRNPDIETRIARFHNIYGPQGSWNDGREKAPAAICRKVAEAKLTGNHEIEVWGDGKQMRSFCYIDDCLEQIYRLMQSDYALPMNIGSDRMVTINELVDIVAAIAGIEVEKKHDLSKPQGVRFRNADLTVMREVLKYENKYSLERGLARTYMWIEGQVRKQLDV